MMDSTLTVLRPRVRQDSVGGTVQEPFTVVVADQPCCTHPMNNGSGDLYGQRETLIKGEIFLLSALDVQANDRVVVTNNATAALTYFNVTGGTRQQSNVRNRLWSVEVEAIQ